MHLPSDIISLISTRKTFKRRIQRTSIPSEVKFYEQSVKLLTKMTNKEVNIYRNEKWNNMLSKLRAGDKSFSRISRGLRGKQNKKNTMFEPRKFKNYN